MYKVIKIASGLRGTKQTLALMSKLVKEYKVNQQIRELAVLIVKNEKQMNWRGEVEAIHNWVKNNIRYVRDVENVETLQTPVKTLELMAGDCDDQTTLFCALMAAIGHPTRMVAISERAAGNFSHVFPQAKIANYWVSAECIFPNYKLGQLPPNIVRKYIKNN